MMYQNVFSNGAGMKRLCGLMIFCTGVGMTWVLILPKSFVMVVIAISLLILGYNLFCCS